jgi:hypothetical protein
MAQYQKGPAYKYNPYGNEIVQYGGPDVLQVSDIIKRRPILLTVEIQQNN